MKQAFKKTLSLILAFTLSLGFLPSTVFAVEGETGMQDSGIAKPALTIGVSSITDSGAVLEFTSDQDGTVYYLVQESSKDKPNASTLQSAESTAASAAEPVTIDEEDLLSDTAYTVYGIVVTEVSQSDDDVATNSEALDTGLSAAVTASPVVSRDFTTDRKNPAAPRVSFITAQRTAEGVDLTFEADQAGTYYCLIYETEAATPDAAAVKAQGDAAGKASGSVTTGSAITILLTTELNMDTHYTASLVAENTQGLLSEVQSLPIEAPVMLRGALLAGTPDTSWYTADPSASSFTISTADQLAGLATLLDGASPIVADGFDGKTVMLTQDIDLSDYQSGSGWVPIGGDYSPFKGTFDGDGHTVTGLTVQGYGLFNTVDGGTVENLQLDGVYITAPNGEIVGGIAATLDGDGSIENCFVSGTIYAPDSGNVGGVAGKNTKGTIRNCISTVNVSGQKYVGGIAGSARGTIENCYAKGNIASDTSGTAAYSSGGIVGAAQVGATIINCAAMNGSATGPTGGTGRVVGTKAANANLVDNNYAAADMLVNGAEITGGSTNDLNGAPKTTADWLTAATWGTSGLKWDTSVWEISDGSLPALKVFGVAPPASFITITQHPASITNAIVGNISGSLSVAASVAPAGTLSYQWYQNTTESNAGGTDVSGANGETFGIPTTLTAGTYYYFCEVSAGATSVRSKVAKVIVSAVADTTAPIPGAAGVFRVETGSSATSTLVKLSWTKATDTISASNELRYYVYCSDSDDIRTAQNCEDNGTLLNYGGTTDIDTLSTTRPGSDTAEYFNIVVKDEAGNKAAYQPAVRNGIVFSTQPSGMTVVQGYVSGTLTASATTVPGASVSYQWYVRDTDIYAVPGTGQISGATNASFTLPTNLTTGDYYYYCKASIDGDRIWTYSDKVKVTVLAEAVTPTITGPTSLNLNEGYSATSTETYTIMGTAPITVSKTAGAESITWNDTTKKLDIAAGLTAGSYAVTLEASHPSDKKGTLTFTLTVAPDPDTVAVAAAKSAAENATYSNMTQVVASSETIISDALKATAEAAVNNPSVSVTINKVDYTAPTAGSTGSPIGTNGSYVFTVTVSKGAQSQTTAQKTITITATAFTGITNAEAVAAAKTALVDGSVNVAFGATQVQKTAAVQNYVNGLLTGDAAGVTAIVTHSSGNQYQVALSKGGETDSKNLSMTINEAPDPDIAIVNTAKSAAEGAAYNNMTQLVATSETIISDALKATAEAAVNNPSVSVTINKVDYTAPTAGSAGSPSGTNGSYVFTVTVSKGTQSQTTAQKIITITATAFTGITNEEAVAAAKTALVDGSVNVAFGATQAQKTAAVQSYVNGLLTGDAAGVTATVTLSSGNQYHVALAKGSATGSKTLFMTINEAPDPDIAIVNTAKSAAENATYSNMTQAVASSETIILDALKATAEAAVNNPDISVTINKMGYTAPTAGSAGSPIGTNGSYVFTITVSKGAQSQTTAQITITITATAFTGITNAEAVAVAKTALVDGSVNVAFGATQAQKTAAVQSYVNGLLTGDAAGVTATVTHSSGNQYQVALSKGSASDNKSLSMVAHEASAPVTVNLVSIKTAMSKTIYTEGEALNLSGLVVALHKSNGDIENVAFADFVSKGILVSPANGALLATSHTKIAITHVLSGKSVDYAITVKSGSDGNGGGSGSGGGSSSGGSSGSTTTPTTTPGKTPNQPVTAAAPVTATAGQNGSASAAIPEKSVTDAIAKSQADAKAQGKTANGTTVALNVTMPKGATSLTATLTRTSLNSLVSAGVTSLELNGSPVTVSFDTKALAEIQKQSSGNISISIAPNAKLSASAKAMIGTRPVYDLTVNYQKDGKNATVSSFGGGMAMVSVPYTPAKGEAIGGLYAVYVDEKGNATRIAGSAYDANSGCVMFTTTHFSLYGIGYTAPSAKFMEVSSHWAKESIDYVVGRGLLSGTEETTFAPDTAMTRGMLVTALGRLANVDTKAYATNSFTDVTPGSAFQPYIEWAYKKGVVQGTGNGKFEPDRAITREEIAVIFANYAKATGYTLPVTRTATTYADASSIGSTYKTAVTAMQQAGIMMGGTSNKFNPKSSATRAEVSSMLHRYIKLTIDPATAQGWAVNDAGQYLYYENGKTLTGTQTIDGTKYFFNDNGTLKTGWVQDGGNWHFYSGNKLLVGWWDIGANGNNKRYYFDTYGNMISGKWLQIDGKWYYFYADGTLAVSTKIDEYEVDENGVRKTK